MSSSLSFADFNWRGVAAAVPRGPSCCGCVRSFGFVMGRRTTRSCLLCWFRLAGTADRYRPVSMTKVVSLVDDDDDDLVVDSHPNWTVGMPFCIVRGSSKTRGARRQRDRCCGDDVVVDDESTWSTNNDRRPCTDDVEDWCDVRWGCDPGVYRDRCGGPFLLAVVLSKTLLLFVFWWLWLSSSVEENGVVVGGDRGESNKSKPRSGNVDLPVLPNETGDDSPIMPSWSCSTPSSSSPITK